VGIQFLELHTDRTEGQCGKIIPTDRSLGRLLLHINHNVPYISTDHAYLLILICLFFFFSCLQATGQRLGIVLQSIMTIVWGVGLAIYYDLCLGLVTICFTPVILLAQYLFLRISRGEIFGNQQGLEKLTEVSDVSDAVK
jgi:hypothetical protein